MGEAKRRKQLGLMPTVFPYEAELTRDGQVKLIKAPEDAALAAKLTEGLQKTQLTDAAWDSEYRTARILSGQERRTFRTAQDVESLKVPELRRVSGDVVLNKTLRDVEGVAIAFDGGVIRLREQRHSFDRQKWESFPAFRDPMRVMRLLSEHPAFNIEGESLGQFRAEQWQEGRIDIDPEPPEGTLELLEDTSRAWHGETPEAWKEIHHELAGEETAPVAKRTFFELRRPSPLQNPRRMVFDTRHNTDIYPLEGSTYSHDGDLWHSYENPEAEAEEDDFMGAFGDLLNMETVQVTVYADGRVEWPEGEIDDEHAERVRVDLKAATGAGNPEEWAAWSRQMLLDTFNAEAQEGGEDGTTEVPTPQAVRLDVPKDALDDPDPLAQTFIESEVTFDGENWRDLYDEEVPQELLLAIARLKPNEQ